MPKQDFYESMRADCEVAIGLLDKATNLAEYMIIILGYGEYVKYKSSQATAAINSDHIVDKTT